MLQPDVLPLLVTFHQLQRFWKLFSALVIFDNLKIYYCTLTGCPVFV